MKQLRVSRLAVVIAVMLLSGAASDIAAEGEGIEDTTMACMDQEVSDEDLDEVLAGQPEDWKEWDLTPAQEQALKRRLYRQGVLSFDAERTSEQEKQFKYLTRLVPISSEAVPEGLVYNLGILFQPGSTAAEIADVLTDLGNPEIVREWRVGDRLSLYLHLPRDDIKMDKLPDDLAEILRRFDKIVSSERDSISGLLRTKTASPPHPCVGPVTADPFTSRTYNVRRHMISIDFRRNPTDQEQRAFELRNHLTEARNRKEFFILRNIPVAQAINEIWNDSLVWNAHPVQGGMPRIHGTLPRTQPTDPYWMHQWNLHQNRAVTDTNHVVGEDSRDHDADSPEGWWLWDQASHTDTAVIAIIDVGFRVDHVDLAGKWLRNPTEVVDGVDNDGNGYVDDEYGWDFWTGTPINSSTTTAGDTTWHGTAVAGMAAGEHNNSKCLVGVNLHARMMPVAVVGQPDSFHNALQYVWEEGANIVNMSLGGFERRDSTQTLIDSMYAHGVLFFAAAGNDNQDEGIRLDYPGDYNHVVVTGGTDAVNRRYYDGPSDGSGWGTGVELSVPAEDLATLHDAGGPETYALHINGTSFACPVISGIAGYVWSKYGPTTSGSDVERIIRILKCAVNDIDGDVTNSTGGSSEPQEGRDDLGWGRPSLFEALAGPRVRKVSLAVGATRMFADGDRDGDGIFDYMDWDLDGDGFDNETDENDDGDRYLDGAAGGTDTDDDGDLLANGSEDDSGSRWNAPGEGALVLALTFNESMGLQEGSTISVSPQDPDVRLVLTDGSELTFAGNAGGDTDWPFKHEVNLDTWFASVDLDSAASAQSAGDIRLRISGTVDVAGDTLDWDVTTVGAQSYDYPLTMPSFRPHSSDPDAGVIRNTTAQGDSTWPLAWGGLLVVARGFNTDEGDPLSVQYMKIWIRDIDRDTVFVNGFYMTGYDRDFQYGWDTQSDPFWDGRREVTVRAYDLTRAQILTDYTRNLVIDNTPPIVKKLELRNIWPGESGPDTTIIRKAEWIDHPTDPELRELEVETQNPMSLDTLEVAITFDQTMCRDSLQIKYRLQKEGGPAWAMNVVRWDSIVYPDDAVVARSAVVWTGTLRSVYAGEYVVEVRGYDTALNRLDADPSTKAQRGVGGAWEGYEEGMRDTPPWTDCNHSFVIERWRDVLLHMDVSASVTNPPTGGWASSAYHMADSLLARIEQDHIDSGRADMWRAGVTRYFGHTAGNSWAVQLLADVSPNIQASRDALMYFVSPPGTPCSSQGEPLDSVVAYLEDPGNHSMPRHVVMFTDGEMNRGVSRAEQEELWVRAATDSTFGCGTFLYAIMPEAKAHLSEGMCAAVVRSGGSYLTIPAGDMIAGYPGGVLYEDLVHNSRIYGAQGEGVVTRSTHWFRVDGLSGSLFLLGSWAPWGLQLAQGEVFCGGLPRCGECGGEGVTQDAEAPVSREEAPAVEAAGMSTRDAEVEGGGEADEEEEARGDGMPRLSMTLYDAEGASVPPTGTIGGSLAWWELSPTDADTGLWRVEVSGGSGPYDLRVSERGGVRIELAGKRLAGVSMGCDVKVRVESEWPMQSPSWSLVDGEGATVAGLSLYDDGLHGDGLSGDGVWGGALAGVAERGLYRVRLRGVVNGMGIERVTGEGLWVTEPEFEFLTPAGIDTVEGYYLITWADSSEFAAQIGLYYDTDSLGADGVLIEGGIEEDADGTGDEYLWNTLSVSEGRCWVYAVIEDLVGPGRVVYSPGSLVVRREYPAGWPVEVGGVIRAPVTVADLDGDGTVEVVVGALDSLLYAFQHDGTHRPGFPAPCQGAITAGVAVGDVDGDGLKEIVVATGDYLGPAWVWVLDDGGNVKSGWPVMTTQGTKGTPLLVNLVGPANSPPEIVVAGYDSLVNAWTGDGSPVPGWPVRLSGMIQNSSPVGGDIDWDGQDEVVVTRTQGEPMTQGAIVAIETDGTIKWEKAMPSYVWSTPVLWDVDKDRRPEILVATSGSAGRLYALNGENGSDASGWNGGKNIGQGSWASPAVGYLNLVDEPRIVVVNGQGRVRAYSSAGDSLANWGDDVTNYLVRTAPVIADIDGDMMTEILLAARYRLYVLAGATGDTISLYTKPLETDTYSTVGVADLDGDGDLEIVAADGAVIRCWDIEGSVWAAGQEWPQFKRDEGKTGRYRESASPQAPAVETIEVVGPDSLRIRWGTGRNDVYGRPEWLRRYRVYRGSAPYQATWGTQVGLVNAPDTTLVEWPGTVNDPNLSSYYRVRAEDLYGNQSALSDETVGEFERNTGAAKGKEKAETERR